ncbi:MAG: DUF1573 domain-containing protein [Ferruginibacter sp.]
MKKLLFSVLAVSLATFAVAQKTIKDVAKLNSETIDLGKVKVGNPQPAQFIVTNVGTEPLIIETASPTCGCTISDYTKSPIEPGKTGFISATYNAANIGHFDKVLTVKFAGVNETMPIKITGDVLSAEDYDKQGNASSQLVKTEEPVKITTATTTAVTTKTPVTKTTKTTTKNTAKTTKVKKPATTPAPATK